MSPIRSRRRALCLAAIALMLSFFVGGSRHTLSAEGGSEGRSDLTTAGAGGAVDEGEQTRTIDAGNGRPSGLEEPCPPMDAHASSNCGGGMVGAIWDGRRCRMLSGCECEGADCDKIHADMESCYRDRGRDCFKCAKMDVHPVSPCETKDGPMPALFWNGRECEIFEACRCVGADCDRLFGIFEATLCEAAYASCKAP